MRRLIVVLLLVFSLSGLSSCVTDPLGNTVSDKPFVSWYMTTSEQIKANPRYQKIPLNTNEQAQEFVNWMHDLYRQQITPEQFERQVSVRYPGHNYEASFIVQCLPPSNARPPQ